jgi:hypothetical protein
MHYLFLWPLQSLRLFSASSTPRKPLACSSFSSRNVAPVAPAGVTGRDTKSSQRAWGRTQRLSEQDGTSQPRAPWRSFTHCTAAIGPRLSALAPWPVYPSHQECISSAWAPATCSPIQLLHRMPLSRTQDAPSPEPFLGFPSSAHHLALHFIFHSSWHSLPTGREEPCGSSSGKFP